MIDAIELAGTDPVLPDTSSPRRRALRVPPPPPSKLEARRDRMTQNIIKNYGAQGLADLVAALIKGESGQVIGDRMGVTRERVRQWKQALGTAVPATYNVHPSVARVVCGACKDVT